MTLLLLVVKNILGGRVGKIRDLSQLNWNDLKYFIALVRNGRLSLASKKLGCSHVTIANRIEALEQFMQTKLFFKNSKGFHLTKSGEKLLPYAEKCERTLRLANEVYRKEQKIHSKIRIGVTEGFGNYYLASRLAKWIKDKAIDVELISLPSVTSISSGAVDISVTLDRQKGIDIIQKKLTPYTLGIFACTEYIANNIPVQSRTDLLQHPFVGYIEDLVFSESLRYHEEISPELKIVYKSTTIHTQRKAVQTGVGLGILPHYVAHDYSTLLRLLPELQFRREYWISTSKDLHRFKDLKRTWDFISDSCEADRHRFVAETHS